jgi:hypothetical protein
LQLQYRQPPDAQFFCEYSYCRSNFKRDEGPKQLCRCGGDEYVVPRDGDGGSGWCGNSSIETFTIGTEIFQKLAPSFDCIPSASPRSKTTDLVGLHSPQHDWNHGGHGFWSGDVSRGCLKPGKVGLFQMVATPNPSRADVRDAIQTSIAAVHQNDVRGR